MLFGASGLRNPKAAMLLNIIPLRIKSAAPIRQRKIIGTRTIAAIAPFEREGPFEPELLPPPTVGGGREQAGSQSA